VSATPVFTEFECGALSDPFGHDPMARTAVAGVALHVSRIGRDSPGHLRWRVRMGEFGPRAAGLPSNAKRWGATLSCVGDGNLGT